jgi:adenylosuccinate synthase
VARRARRRPRAALGKLQIGTTRRGIGPAYADKATRIGIRVQDLLDPKILREKVELAASEKNVWLERVYGIDPFDAEEVVARTLEHAERLAPYVADTSLLVDRALRDGRRVLFEGAQGTLLDLDHGTYPFVTSSSPIAAGAAVSFGLGPQRIDEVLGVSKAYVTRVGEGPSRARSTGPRRSACASSAVSSARDRARAPLRLARPRGAAIRRPCERHHVARADEARRALVVRRDPGLRALPPPRPVRDRRLPGPSVRLPPLRAGVRDPRGLERRPDRHRAPDAATAYVSFVADALDVPVTLVGTGASRDAVLALQP